MRTALLVLALLVLAACRPPVPAARHLVLVTLDTVRADRLGAYGRKDAETPWLDGLARRGTRFARAYTAAPLTLPAHVSILTGRYPTATGIHLNGEHALTAGVRTAAELLSGQGFFTAAAIGGYPLAARFPTRKGFELYDDALRVGPAGEALERPASEVVRAALHSLSSRGDRRVFLWVHLFDWRRESPRHSARTCSGSFWRTTEKAWGSTGRTPMGTFSTSPRSASPCSSPARACNRGT